MRFRLGINGWRLCAPHTGVARYLLNVIRYWTPEATTRFSAITIYTPAPLDRRLVPLPPNIRERVLGPRLPMIVWENLRFGPAADEDVLFCPSYSRPIVARGRTVVATHDVIYHVRPELFPPSVRVFYRRLYDWSDRHAAAITTLGHAVKREIVEHVHVPPERVHAIHPAPADTFRPVHDAAAIAAVRARRTGGDAPFFLFVGKMTGRRSLPCLLQAFALVKQRGLPHRLVLAGLKPAGGELDAEAARLGIAADIIFTGYVDDEELNLLYNAAESFVMPSVYETTSLPAMEAQAAGLPVIALDTEGLRELTADTALQVAAMEPGPLSTAMLCMAADPDLRRDLSARGLENARRFSWRRTSAETMAVCEAAAIA
jgi:glycosyltransferase involved in cell wall biosynthesis